MSRPMGTFKTGTDQDKIAKFEKKPINEYRSKYCTCVVRTRIKVIDCQCTVHGHVLTATAK